MQNRYLDFLLEFFVLSFKDKNGRERWSCNATDLCKQQKPDADEKQYNKSI